MNNETEMKSLEVTSVEEFLTLLKDQTALWGEVETLSEQDKKILEYKEAVRGYAFKDTEVKSVAVHSGTFHADDVVCVALLELGTGKTVTIIRSRDAQELSKADFCCDVAESLLDHHKSRALDRVSAVSRFALASFNTDLEVGWDEDITFSSEEGTQMAMKLWNEVIVPVAEWDTGHADKQHPFPGIHRLCEHTVATDGDMDVAFRKAVDETKQELRRMLETWSISLKAQKEVEKEIAAQQDEEVIVFHNLICRKVTNTKELIYKSAKKAIYYISPENAEDWRVLCCCDPEKPFSGFGSRKLIPEAYRGLDKEDLTSACGIEGGIFVHKDGFVAGFKSLEAAEAFARKALQE